MLEVVVSIAVLTIGLMGMAFMMSNTIMLGSNARYMNMANVLASEKLDSLNKLPYNDQNIFCVTVCGSLTGPSTCASTDVYCDMVTVSEATGADYETQTQYINGAAQTTTIVHTGSGCVNTPTICGAANPPAGSTFTRRWLITYQPTIGGLTATANKRITVIVTLNEAMGHPVTFQMSMVRP